MTQDKPTSTRGFASMDKEKQRQIARKGGEATHTAAAIRTRAPKARADTPPAGRRVPQNRFPLPPLAILRESQREDVQ